MNPNQTFRLLLLLAIGFAFSRSAFAIDPAQMGPPPEGSGQYLVQVAGCADCHSTSDDLYMAGGKEFKIPWMGTIYTPNLTPDPVNGIGKWTFDDFKRALREGRGPDGHFYYPVFPYRSYTKITDGDLHKMWDYFRSLPPIPVVNRPAEMKIPRPLVRGWNYMFVSNLLTFSSETRVKRGQGAFQEVADQSPEWNRGAYIAEALTHCTECHTYRDPITNGPWDHYWMSGGVVNGVVAPNITSDQKTGKGNWDLTNWDEFLNTGMKPNGEHIRNDSEMWSVIQNLATLSDKDRLSLAVYLHALKPVRRGEDAK